MCTRYLGEEIFSSPPLPLRKSPEVFSRKRAWAAPPAFSCRSLPTSCFFLFFYSLRLIIFFSNLFFSRYPIVHNTTIPPHPFCLGEGWCALARVFFFRNRRARPAPPFLTFKLFSFFLPRDRLYSPCRAIPPSFLFISFHFF